MKAEIIEKSENPLLECIEIKFKVDHAGGPTPKRPEVRAQLAALLGTPEELLVIDKLASTHGHQVASGIARAYKSREQLEQVEPKYLLKRGLPKEAKPAEEKPKKEKPEKAEKPEEAKPEEKAKEEVEEKPKEEAKGGKGS